MDAQTRTIVEDCTRRSVEEQHSFPKVVGALIEAGVERYHADLTRAENTFYMPDGTSHLVASYRVPAAPANDFDAPRVGAAIRAVQKREIGYRTFCDRIAAAGCVAYIVSMPGRRAVYYGRTGEMFVEPFPGAA